MARYSTRNRDSQVVSPPVWATHNYEGGIIREATLGPRRELTLRIELWPEGQISFGGGDTIVLRLGAIDNYEEVQRFFAEPHVEELHCLRYLSASRPKRKIVEMEFDRTDERIKIVAGNVSFQ